jgi:predicted helicase
VTQLTYRNPSPWSYLRPKLVPFVYLTNALTGWEPPTGEKQEFLYPEMKEEHDKAGSVKQSKEILVVLGNPPYNGFAGVAVQEERDLSDAYRAGGDGLKPQGQGLNDLYIRFFRMAERCIAEKTRHGVVCFISNYSWLSGRSYPVMRESFLERFDSIWIDNLHGDRIISEYAPDGRTSETVFALKGSSAGIKVGTSIATLVRRENHKGGAALHYRDWQEAKAAERRAALVTSLSDTNRDAGYKVIKPSRALGLPFRPKRRTQTILVGR